MTDDMVTWLHGALAELERVAREATPAPWVDENGKGPYLREGHVYGRGITPDHLTQVCSVELGATPRADTRHIALNDPRSVLARVEAARAILAAHSERAEGWVDEPRNLHRGEVCLICAQSDRDGEREDNVAWPCRTLRWLAYGHRFDADGFDPAWAPEGVETQ